MAKITLEGITKVFDNKIVAADEVDFEIPDGEIVSLLGPSGCGKTTIMRIIAGFEEPNAGKVYINDRDVTDLPPEKRNISMVFQFPVVYDTMSIYENLATPLRVLKFNKEKIGKVVEESADLFGVDRGTWHQKARKLSISERQRVSLAHAFIVERNVYILDEPFSNIDPKSRVILIRYVREIQRKMGHTLIFVTHSQSEALTVSDKIAVMKEGKILQYGTPEEIYRKPANMFIGWFLGNPGMNYINGVVKSVNGKYVIDTEFFKWDQISKMCLGKISIDEKVILGIRPEDIEISPMEKEGCIPGICRFSEPIGSRVLLNVELGKEVMVNIKVPMDVGVSVGDNIYLFLLPDKVMLFNAKTGEALM